MSCRIELPRFSSKTTGIAFPSIVGLVAFGFSYFVVPEDFIMFRLFAVLAAMSGYEIASMLADILVIAWHRIVAILATLSLFISSAFR
jgi:hypothetical protein